MNRSIAPSLLAALALAACGPADDTSRREPPAPTATATAPPPALTPSPVTPRLATTHADLLGEWRVAGIDGAEVSGDMGIAVSIDETSLSYEPTCLGFVWQVSYQGEGRIALTRDSNYGPQRAADGSVVSCLPAVTPAFGQLAEVLDAAIEVNRLASGALEFSGGGRSAVLFRQ